MESVAVLHSMRKLALKTYPPLAFLGLHCSITRPQAGGTKTVTKHMPEPTTARLLVYQAMDESFFRATPIYGRVPRRQ